MEDQLIQIVTIATQEKRLGWSHYGNNWKSKLSLPKGLLLLQWTERGLSILEEDNSYLLHNAEVPETLKTAIVGSTFEALIQELSSDPGVSDFDDVLLQLMLSGKLQWCKRADSISRGGYAYVAKLPNGVGCLVNADRWLHIRPYVMCHFRVRTDTLQRIEAQAEDTRLGKIQGWVDSLEGS